jgi:hypothetical protein
MGSRLLPRDLHELYAHALALEHAAAKRFVEMEYADHFLGPQGRCGTSAAQRA